MTKASTSENTSEHDINKLTNLLVTSPNAPTPESLNPEERLQAYKRALDLVSQKLVDTERMLKTSQAFAKVGSVELDLQTKELTWSDETYRIHDTSPEEYTPLLADKDLYLPESGKRISEALQHAIKTGEVFDIDVEKYTLKGRRIDLRTTCVLTCQEGVPVKLSGIFHDITQQKKAERRHEHHHRILEMLLQNRPLREILYAIAEYAERQSPASQASILLLAEDGQHLHHGATPSLPEHYINAIDGVKIGREVGSCGTAAFYGKRVVVENIQRHPYWKGYTELAESANLRACWSEPILSAQGQVLGTFAIYHSEPKKPKEADIELIEFEAKLLALAIEKSRTATQQKLAASVFTHAREGILITAADGKVVGINQTLCDMTGYTREFALGKHSRFLRSSYHDSKFYKNLRVNLMAKGHWAGEIWNKKKTGELYATMATISVILNEHSEPQNFVTLFTDITDLKTQQRQLEHIAHYDALTQLPNRVLLNDTLKQAMSRSKRTGSPLAVLYLDLDGFKLINDKLGHSEGDKALISISQQLNGVLREQDMLARIGGDEFVITLTDLESKDAYKAIVERLLCAASKPYQVDDHHFSLSASIGVTLFPTDDVSADTLLCHADQAMYTAKENGKNCYCIYEPNDIT